MKSSFKKIVDSVLNETKTLAQASDGSWKIQDDNVTSETQIRGKKQELNEIMIELKKKLFDFARDNKNYSKSMNKVIEEIVQKFELDLRETIL